MIKPEVFADLATRISKIIPDELSHLRSNTTAIIKEIIQDHYARMDLVTKEEFEIQTALLHKTKKKLQDLEAKLIALEQTEK